MKALIFAACVAAAPAFAYDTMTAQTCQDSWDAFEQALVHDLISGGEAVDLNVSLGDGNWCVLEPRHGGLDNGQPEAAYFRIEGAAPFIAGRATPTAIALRIPDYNMGGRFYQHEIHLRHLSDTGQIIVESYQLQHEDGSGIVASAVLQGAYFTSVAGLQTSMFGMRMSEMHANVSVNRAFLDDLDVDLNAVTRVRFGRALRDVPRANFDTASRQAFLAFVASRNGSLDVSMTSENGLGWMQVVIPLMQIEDAPTDDEIATAVGLILSGLVLDMAFEAGAF